jgi:7-cyano-7-deazaguanine synthase
MKRSLVLLSGGQDSATCLFWALKNYDYVETIGFNYGQRHSIELEIRLEFIKELKKDFPDLSLKLGEDHLINATNLSSIGDTAMTSDIEIEMSSSGLPNTFVPGRNLYFFTLASAVAYRRNLSFLVGGMCETDYSGYPDCRRETMDALQSTLSLGTDKEFEVITPLMWIDKAKTWEMALDLGGNKLINIIKNYTHTCYIGDRSQLNDWGFGCGQCPACELRKKGYIKWQEGLSISS